MQTFEPLINVIVLLTILSVMAERATNLMKLRNQETRVKKADLREEKDREYKISARGMFAGIVLAILVKADLFAILSRMDAPWETIGWVYVDNYRWVRSAASVTLGGFGYAIAGCILTGIALGFGSKFWHDIAGTIYELRDSTRRKKGLLPVEGEPQDSPAGGPNG